MTSETEHVTHDSGRDSVLKICSQRITDSVSQQINYKGVGRTALATQGLLNIRIHDFANTLKQYCDIKQRQCTAVQIVYNPFS